MNPEEYAKLERIDREHWFYRGKREIVRHWIGRYLSLRPGDLLIDAGCGTGTMLVEMSSQCRVLGLDDHDESISLARPKVHAIGGGILQTDLRAIPLAGGCATVALLLDVLEHLDEPAAALDEMIRVVRPGGLLLITVPALRWLWSDWDVALHHRRRYHRRDFAALLARPGVELLRCGYINTVMLLPIAAVRLWRRILPPPPGRSRAEDSIPPAPLNAILRRCFVAPACLEWFRPPAGVSLLAALRRKAA